MKARASVSKAVLACAELAEVLGGLRDSFVVQLEYDAAGGGVVDGDIKLAHYY